MKIILYGTERCHKTRYYLKWFKDQGLRTVFRDVEQNPQFESELRGMYKNGKLNFPTILIGAKKLRNPAEYELNKWLKKLNDEKQETQHNER